MNNGDEIFDLTFGRLFLIPYEKKEYDNHNNCKYNQDDEEYEETNNHKYIIFEDDIGLLYLRFVRNHQDNSVPI